MGLSVERCPDSAEVISTSVSESAWLYNISVTPSYACLYFDDLVSLKKDLLTQYVINSISEISRSAESITPASYEFTVLI